MPALMKKLTDNARAALRCRRLPKMNRKERGPLRLLEEFLSGYLPEAKAVRTRDARGRPALQITVAGRLPWILTPATGALALNVNQLVDRSSERSEGCAA
jgi:hypothetical protein